MVSACGQAPPSALPVAPPPAIASAWPASPIDASPPPPPPIIDVAADAGAPPAAAPATPTVAPTVGSRGPLVGRVRLRLPKPIAPPDGLVSCHDFGPTYRGCNPPRTGRSFEIHEVPLGGVRRVAGGVVVNVPVGRHLLMPAGEPVAVRWPRPPGGAPAARVHATVGDTVDIEVALDMADLADGLELELGAADVVAWRSLPPVEARIVTVDAVGDRRIIKLDVGTADGVAKGTTGVVLDRAGRPLPGGRFVVVVVGVDRAIAKVDLDLGRAALKRAGRVRFDRR